MPEGIFNYRVVGVLRHAGRTLLQRAETDDFWVLPGGRGEFGEESSATIRREFLEEIGLTVKVERLLWVVENFFERTERYHEISFYYLVKAVDPAPEADVFLGRREDREPQLVFRWATIEELAQLRVYPDFLPGVLADPPGSVTHIVHREGSQTPA